MSDQEKIESLAKQHGLILNGYGFYEVEDKPSLDELAKFYSEEYYQTAQGSYELEYGEPELNYLRAKIRQRFQYHSSKVPLKASTGRLLDVGCGEGHALAYYRSQGWDVRGLDFSVAGCERMNPDCLPFLTQGDIYHNLEALIVGGDRFDVIVLDNVLEHVLDPLGLMKKLLEVLSETGVLIVDVPNDFSKVQMAALEAGYVDDPFWISVPAHLSYFNPSGLENLAKSAGFASVGLLGDFPVDIYLLNPNSNYWGNVTEGANGVSRGRAAHDARILIENQLDQSDDDEVNRMFEAMGRVGLGRCIAGFFVPAG